MKNLFILGVVILLIDFISKILSRMTADKNIESSFADLRDTSSEMTNENEIPEEFDEKYFERCQKGESHQLFLKVASLQDCTMIQSLFASQGVPSHREHEHFNSIYGSGTSNLLSTTFSIQLWILTADYEKAFEIARDFVQQKCENLKSHEQKSKGHKLTEGILAILFSPYPITKSYQTLGITIFPKSEK